MGDSYTFTKHGYQEMQLYSTSPPKKKNLDNFQRLHLHDAGLVLITAPFSALAAEYQLSQQNKGLALVALVSG